MVDKVTSRSFVCSFVYAYNVVVGRRDLWSSLISWGINNYEPWILLGDFNNTLYLEDIKGDNRIANCDMDDFLSCTMTLGIEDAFSLGNRFTLSNGNH